MFDPVSPNIMVPYPGVQRRQPCENLGPLVSRGSIIDGIIYGSVERVCIIIQGVGIIIKGVAVIERVATFSETRL